MQYRDVGYNLYIALRGAWWYNSTCGMKLGNYILKRYITWFDLQRFHEAERLVKCQCNSQWTDTKSVFHGYRLSLYSVGCEPKMIFPTSCPGQSLKWYYMVSENYRNLLQVKWVPTLYCIGYAMVTRVSDLVMTTRKWGELACHYAVNARSMWGDFKFCWPMHDVVSSWACHLDFPKD